jgi:hypothetical protein
MMKLLFFAPGPTLFLKKQFVPNCGQIGWKIIQTFL